MKNFLLSLILCLTISSAFSQAVLTAMNMSAIGDSASYMLLDTAGLDTGASGTGVTWDFSSATILPGDPVTWKFITPAGPFSTADLCLTNSKHTECYDSVGADSWIKVFEMDSTATLGNPATYSNPETIYEFPTGMGSLTADSFAASFSVLIVVAQRKGTDSSMVDGTGTIILPDGRTYNNVIRLLRHVVWQDSGAGFGFTVKNKYNLKIVEWWDSAGKFPLMRIESNNYTAFTDTNISVVAYYKLLPPVGIEAELNANIGTMIAFPNPTTSIATVNYELANAGEIKISLHDIQGREISNLFSGYRNPGVYSLELNGQTLSTGSYYLRLSNSAGIISKKLIVR